MGIWVDYLTEHQDISGKADKSNTYTKTEVNNLISNTPQSDVVVVQGQSGVNPTTLLPNPGTKNVIYRIMSASGDSFTEYAWNGTSYTTLAVKNTGVDTLPTAGSQKFVLSDGVAKKDGICLLRNGSGGNVANSNAVCTWVVPVGNANLIRFETDRPNNENCRYVLAWYTGLNNNHDYELVDFSNVSDKATFVGPVVDYKSDDTNHTLDIRNLGNIKSVACTVAEYNYVSGSYNPLRIGSFDNYHIKLTQEDANSTTSKKDRDTLIIRNGTVNNRANANCVATEFIPLDGSRYISIVTNRPNKSGCVYLYGWAVSKLMDDVSQTYQWGNDSNHKVVEVGVKRRNNTVDLFDTHYVGYSSYVAIAFHIGEINTSTGNYSPLRMQDFLGYDVKVVRSNFIEPVIDNAINGESVVKCMLRNGSTGNSGNANAVATFLVPTLTFSSFELKTTRPNRQGYHYRYTVDFSSSSYGDNSSGDYNEARTEHVDNQYRIGRFVRTLSESRGVQFAIWEVNEAENALNPLRISDFVGYEVYIIRSGVFDPCSVVTASQDKLPVLAAACRYRKDDDNTKDFQLMIVTDAHDDNIALRRAVTATNGVNTIDAIINCGDTVDYIDTYYEQSNLDLWGVPAKKCNKPFYCVVGNHDAGEYQPVYVNIPDDYLYRYFIKPSVDAGHLLPGEYTENKYYYYHDFDYFKIRLIVLYEFETPLIYDTTYWTPITYSSSLPVVKWNTSYNAGDEVRDFYRTDVGFRATQSFTTPYEGDFRKSVSNGNTLPCLKYPKGRRWISHTQAQWFLNTLLSTPANYMVIVACHTPLSKNAGVVQSSKFSQKGIYEQSYPYLPTLMSTDFIANAINAFQTGINYSETCISTVPSDIPSYTVSADFRNKNSGVKFHSMIGGHTHKDFVWKHNTYNILDVTPICANTNYPAQCPNADIRRSCDVQSDGKDVDCLTVVTYKESSMCLVKIGVDITDTMEKRDYEVINI